jgi:CheY-like chemotaxis protein
MRRIRLIHWKAEEGEKRAEYLRSLGYTVEFESFSPQTMKYLREDPPDAIVIDLTRLPSQGRDLGLNLRKQKSTRNSILIFAAGDPTKVKKIREILSDATFATWKAIKFAIDDAFTNPPVSPIVPDSVFAAYSGTPLPKKLGIKSDALVALIDPPDQVEEILGQLPDGVSLVTGGQPADVHLWFVCSIAELKSNFEGTGVLAASGPLWIIWPKKTSKLASDLTQNVVRQTGLDRGLVDYKICSLDKDWSGLCFTQRKR